MKILIAVAQFSSSLSGLQRHAINVVRCLVEQPDISEVHVILAPWQQELSRTSGLTQMKRVTTHIAEMEKGVWSRNRWYYQSLPNMVSEIRPDILHLSYPVPVDASSIACPIVLTLHDLYPYEVPENFGFFKGIFNRLVLQQCLHSVDAIACVSDTTLLGLRQHATNSIDGQVLRIYNCVESETECAEQSPIPGWQGEPFLLSVSQHRKNKNIPLLVRTFHRLLSESLVDPEMKLVIIGIPGPETKRIHRLISSLRIESRVVFLHGLPEASLQWCYQCCEALVAPSETEGFGLPVAEALLAGCRVVCSDIPAFHEIDEDHQHFVALGPGAESRFAHAIVASLDQPRLLPTSLPQFSRAVLGKEYVSLYRSLIVQAHLRGAEQGKQAPNLRRHLL